MQQHAGHVAQCGLRAPVLVASHASAVDLLVEDVEDVPAQRHHCGGEVALLGRVAEGAGVAVDDRARGIRGTELLERRVDLDRLEVEQFDARQLGDVGRHVARQAEVDHELSALEPGNRGARQRCDEWHDGCRELLTSSGDQRPVDHVVLGRRAGHDEVDAGGHSRVLTAHDGLDAVIGREPGRPARRREDPNVRDAPVAEGRERRAREASGAHEQHARLGPVGDPALGKIEREAHE